MVRDATLVNGSLAQQAIPWRPDVREDCSASSLPVVENQRQVSKWTRICRPATPVVTCSRSDHGSCARLRAPGVRSPRRLAAELKRGGGSSSHGRGCRRSWCSSLSSDMAAVAGLDVYAPVIAKLDLGGPAAYGVMTAALVSAAYAVASSSLHAASTARTACNHPGWVGRCGRWARMMRPASASRRTLDESSLIVVGPQIQAGATDRQ
jgi:hypothetical protein